MGDLSQKESEVERSNSLVPLPQETVSLEAVNERKELLRLAIKDQFKREKHYGEIPGTKHDTLWKPGCELILAWHKLHEDPQVAEHFEEWGTEKGKQPFFHFLVRSTIYRYVPGPNGEPVRVDMGSALGEANTGETRYSHRWVWPNKMSERMHKQAKTEGWEYRETRNGGKQYKCPTPKEEVRGQYNTILKMAQIRALRSSLAKVCATSEFFGDEADAQNFDNRKAGTSGNPDYIPPKESKPKASKPRTTTASSANPKQVAELKFIKDVLTKDPERFKATGKVMFDDKYKGKGWSDWSPEDITKFKEALSQPATQPPVDKETGELLPSKSQDPWFGEGEAPSRAESAAPPATEPADRKYFCGTCKNEISEERASLYEGAPGGAICQVCSKKLHEEKTKDNAVTP